MDEGTENTFLRALRGETIFVTFVPRQNPTRNQTKYAPKTIDHKTEAGTRQVPIAALAKQLIADWRSRVRSTDPDALVFATSSGKPISPNNVLRRWVYPACEALGLRRASWLTFRRTYSSWAHERGVPGKVVAQLMGHAKVDTTLNVYTQVMDGGLRDAADAVGAELFTIVH